MYEVIKHFTDMQDNNFSYNKGDIYPRSGLTPTDKRIKELASKQNRQKTPLIKKATPNEDKILTDN